MQKYLIFILLLFIVSCSTNPISEENKLFCNTDVDCEIKNVGNCCGYFPQCVNANYEPNLTKVQEVCFEEGIVSVCGWEEIKGCKCVDNQCQDLN